MTQQVSYSKTLNPLGGISGDMFLCSAYSAQVFTVDELTAYIDASPLGGIPFRFTQKTTVGISATQLTLDVVAKHHSEYHHHHNIDEVLDYAHKSDWSQNQKDIYIAIFSILADAEARIHGISSDLIHFHEVGAVDSIFDVAAASFIIDRLGDSNWFYYPLPLSIGTIRISHGEYPAFSPAVKLLLEGFEFAAGANSGECITPTGAAILSYLMPEKIQNWYGGTLRYAGSGMGTRERKDRPNVLFLDLFDDEKGGMPDYNELAEYIQEICFEVDDMTSESIALALDLLRKAPGVIDVISYSVLGKKARIVTSIRILVESIKVEVVSRLCFEVTSTIGIRLRGLSRRVLLRKMETIAELPVKIINRPSGTTIKPESEALSGLSFRESEVLTSKLKTMFYDKEDRKNV